MSCVSWVQKLDFFRFSGKTIKKFEVFEMFLALYCNIGARQMTGKRSLIWGILLQAVRRVFVFVFCFFFPSPSTLTVTKMCNEVVQSTEGPLQVPVCLQCLGFYCIIHQATLHASSVLITKGKGKTINIGSEGPSYSDVPQNKTVGQHPDNISAVQVHSHG